MLKTFRRKICPLMSLAMFFGCGKKISEASSGLNSSVQPQNLPSVLVLQLKDSFKMSYKLTKGGWFDLPEKLFARTGNALGKSVSLKYNYKEDEDSYEFKCVYKSTVNPAELPIQQCYDEDNNELGDMSLGTSILDPNSEIQMELIGSNGQGLTIEANHSVTWK